MKPEQSNQKKQVRIIRVFSKDMEEDRKVYPALTKVKGISWAISNAICTSLGIEKTKELRDLTEEEMNKIITFRKKLKFPSYLLNRKKDFDSGEDLHLIGVDLELKKSLDIRRLKKIKSYRGYRHTLGLPTRGQRTRSNFRKNRVKGSGIKKKSKKLSNKTL